MKTAIDFDAVRELELYAENTAMLYHRYTMPVVENLKKKHSKGLYDTVKAVKAFEHVVEAAAKMYHNEFGGACAWYSVFNKATRHEVAKNLEKVYFEEYIA